MIERIRSITITIAVETTKQTHIFEYETVTGAISALRGYQGALDPSTAIRELKFYEDNPE